MRSERAYPRVVVTYALGFTIVLRDVWMPMAYSNGLVCSNPGGSILTFLDYFVYSSELLPWWICLCVAFFGILSAISYRLMYRRWGLLTQHILMLASSLVMAIFYVVWRTTQDRPFDIYSFF